MIRDRFELMVGLLFADIATDMVGFCWHPSTFYAMYFIQQTVCKLVLTPLLASHILLVERMAIAFAKLEEKIAGHERPH